MRLSECDFTKLFPDFMYLSPSDKDKFINNLSTDFDFITDHSSGKLKEIVKRKSYD